MKKTLIIILIFFLGCTVKYNINIADLDFREKIFLVKQEGVKNILFVIKSKDSIRFIMQNPMGVPIYRKIYKDNIFKNDGFMPINNHIDKFFAIIIDMIKDNLYKKTIILKDVKYEVEEIGLFE